MKNYTEIFKVLGDESRLRILCLLINANQELCCCEITDALELPQYNVSKHLKILRNAGLVSERKEGRWIYFSLKKNDDLFKNAVLKSVSSIPKSLVAKDRKEFKKRLKIRVHGKCLLGIQKKHLLRSR